VASFTPARGAAMKYSLTKKILTAVIIAFLCIIEGSSQYRSSSQGGDAYSTCNENCKSFTGQARFQCLKTCVSATRRTQRGGKRDRSKYSRCAEVCKSLKGLDSVKCIRLCMDRGTENTNVRREKKESSMLKNCKRRCEVLDGNFRYRCIRSCMNRHRR